MAKGHGNGRANANNHANQMNPNNAAYWSSRGTPAPGEAAPALATPPAPAPAKK
jgi:hypothetical protein